MDNKSQNLSIFTNFFNKLKSIFVRSDSFTESVPPSNGFADNHNDPKLTKNPLYASFYKEEPDHIYEEIGNPMSSKNIYAEIGNPTANKDSNSNQFSVYEEYNSPELTKPQAPVYSVPNKKPPQEPKYVINEQKTPKSEQPTYAVADDLNVLSNGNTPPRPSAPKPSLEDSPPPRPEKTAEIRSWAQEIENGRNNSRPPYQGRG